MSPKRNPAEPAVAVGYTRVSTKREEMISPELQAHEQDTYASRNGIRIVERVEDLDLSGREFARRSVDYIVQGIREGRWNTVLLWKWSRWGRNLLQSRLYLAEVEQAGGQVIAVTEDFDTTTSVGKFSRDQMLAIAELQSNQIGEGWKEAHERRRRNGLPHTGWPRLGYTYSKAEGYKPEPGSSEMLADCYERYVEGGQSMRSLAQMVNANGYRTARGGLFTNLSLARVMDTGFAAGLIRERSDTTVQDEMHRMETYDVWRKGAHDAIISMELWEKYQEKRLAVARRPPRLRVPQHEASGLTCCGRCNGSMYCTTGGSKNNRAWRCSNSLHNKSCPGISIQNNRLVQRLREWVIENADGGETIEEDARRVLGTQAALSNIDAQEAEIKRLKSKRKRLLDIFTDGGAEEEDYKEQKNEIDSALQEAEAAIQLAKNSAKEFETDYRAIFTSLAELWDEATPQERRELLSKVVRRIIIKPGTDTPKRNLIEIIPRWANEAEKQ